MFILKSAKQFKGSYTRTRRRLFSVGVHLSLTTWGDSSVDESLGVQ